MNPNIKIVSSLITSTGFVSIVTQSTVNLYNTQILSACKQIMIVRSVVCRHDV